MGGCTFFHFSLVQYKLSRLRAFYRSHGLRSHLITIDNGSTIHCWVHSDRQDEPKRKTSWRVGRQSQQPVRPYRQAPRERLRTRQDYAGGRRGRGFWRGGRGQQQPPRPPPTRPLQEPLREPPPIRPLHQKPNLLFIHGFGGDGLTAWQHQIAAFAKDYRVIVPDLLFFGKSTTRHVDRTEIFQADCIAKMLMKLNVRKTHVVGTSYGGFVACWLAYKYPQLCWKVVFSSAGICMNPHTNDYILSQCNLTSIDEILLPTTVDGLKLAFSWLYAKPPLLPDFIVQQILDVFYKREDRRHRVELLNAVALGSDRFEVPILNQESFLIIWGREDHLFELPLAKQLQEHLGVRRAQLVIIEGASHMPQVEKHREFNAVIRNFLDDWESSRSNSRSR